MAYEDLMPAADKWLHPDGSVKASAGELILPAEVSRAKQYEEMSPQAAKWLLPDGSVSDALPLAGGGTPGEAMKPYYFASCATAGTTIIKVLEGLPAGYVPSDGDILIVKFNGSSNVARAVKFKAVDGTTEYPVLFNGLATNETASAWKQGGQHRNGFQG